MVLAKIRPWIRGLIDGLTASDLIRSSSLSYKNRIAFIILDSTLEITFKNYIVNVKKIANIPNTKWKFRDEIHKIMKKKTSFEKQIWDDIEYFYELRTGLYHEDASKTVPDETIENFQELVEFVIDELFGIESSKLVAETKSNITLESEKVDESDNIHIPINEIKEIINVIVIAVSESKSTNATEINAVLRKLGLKKQLLNSYVNRYLNNIFKHLFYYDQFWRLSQEGTSRLDTIRKSYVTDKGEEN